LRGLLDVNVLVALMDPDHTLSERAHAWWAANQVFGWASCPVTENGLIRVLSNPNYSSSMKLSPAAVLTRLEQFVAATDHVFWPDLLSLRNTGIFEKHWIVGPAQITDIYLLALAASNDGRLVTFDRRIPRSAVPAAGPDCICLL
jgi:toxin-antitoxin system PIN domain toxin